MIDGFVHPAFGALSEALLATVRRRPGGAALCVYHRGEPVVDVWSGVTDRRRTPWQRDTLCTSFSTGKAVISTALHVLADRGLIDYDAPVATYWPEFAAAGKQDVTVRHVLCHEAGLHRIRGVVDDAFDFADWAGMCDRLAAAPTAWPPGTRNGYHGLTFGWLVGGIIERVSGKPLAEFLDSEIVAPLSLDGAYFGVPPGERHRLARLAPRGDGRYGSRDGDRDDGSGESPRALAMIQRVERFRQTRAAIDAFYVPRFNALLDSDALQDAPMPAFNGAFTARSLARVYAALANGGALDEVRLLSRETVRAASTVQNTRLDAVVFFRMRWRLGYHMAATSRGVVPAGFGHFGYGGSGAWCDPDAQLAVAFTTNTLAGTPFGDSRLLRLGALARAAARRRG